VLRPTRCRVEADQLVDSLWVRVSEMAPSPMSAPPPGGLEGDYVVGSDFILPFLHERLHPRRGAEGGRPEDRSGWASTSPHTGRVSRWCCHDMQPVDRADVRGPPALPFSLPHAVPTRSPDRCDGRGEVSLDGAFLTPLKGSRICVAFSASVSAIFGLLLLLAHYSRTHSQWVLGPACGLSPPRSTCPPPSRRPPG